MYQKSLGQIRALNNWIAIKLLAICVFWSTVKYLLQYFLDKYFFESAHKLIWLLRPKSKVQASVTNSTQFKAHQI